MTRIVISPAADTDLEDIWWTIAADDPFTATRIVRAIGAKVKAEHPPRGPRRADIQPDLRMLVEGPYLVLYETLPDADDGPVDEVNIVRIVDGRRDLTRLFYLRSAALLHSPVSVTNLVARYASIASAPPSEP